MSDREMVAELRNIAAAVRAVAEVQQVHTRLLQLVLDAATETAPADGSRVLLERIAAQLDALTSKVDAVIAAAPKKR